VPRHADDVKGQAASGSNREGESTEAGRRGGAARSSVEGPVMGLERRGCVVRPWPLANWKQEEPADEAKPFPQRSNIGSRVTREGHARFWERPEVQFLRATRREPSLRARSLPPSTQAIRHHLRARSRSRPRREPIVLRRRRSARLARSLISRQTASDSITSPTRAGIDAIGGHSDWVKNANVGWAALGWDLLQASPPGFSARLTKACFFPGCGISRR